MILSNLFSTLLRQMRQGLARRTPHAAAQLLDEGYARQQLRDFEGARTRYEQLLAIDPDNGDAHYLLGVAYAQDEKYQFALDHLLRAVSLKPDFADAYVDLGTVYRLLRDPVAAESNYRKALSLAPDTALAHFNLATLLREAGKKERALDHLKQAHVLMPQSGDVYWNLVVVLVELGQYTEAVGVAETAVRNDPRSYEAQVSLGLACQKTHAVAEALACYDTALSMRTGDAELHNNRAIVLRELGRLPEALADHQRALQLRPDFPLARFHRALAYLMMGDFARGWIDYETRLLSMDRPTRPVSFPRWDGAPLAERTLLVYGDQGLGDEIMFASCLPEVIREAGHCVIECTPKLSKLFARSFRVATVYARAPGGPMPAVDRLRDVDLEVPSSSLPLYYRRSLSDFPQHKGYLVADPDRVQHWRERLAELGSGLKIGISWRGGTYETRSPKRSISLERWLPILPTTGTQFVSLQYTDGAVSELAALRKQHGVDIVHWPEAIEDYDETAALVTALDLTISVCTAVVHLCGALGMPVWVMAPYSPEWRYGCSGESMPWYPSVRIFRQPRFNEWQPVVEKVAREIRAFARNSMISH